MLLTTDRYLERKIDRFLQVWQETPGHKPLLIKGARQIGKTEAVRHFARGRYAHFHEINFVLREEFKQIVEDGCSVASILRRISLIEPTWRFEAGKTLIFFDEVQDLPQIAASLKSFAQDGRFDVIASGSMLGIQYKQISSRSLQGHFLGNQTAWWKRGVREPCADIAVLVHVSVAAAAAGCGRT